ncbi:MAG: tetratricopeptide repeat protein [Anaerolineaceae bacterium]|nr:tetratricopeptide repeat protein [Anaerolineaceae bacterium]
MEPKLSESVGDWLRYLKNSKADTLNWLAPHEDTLLSILQHGLNWEPEFLKSFELLTAVFPYFGLTLSHIKQWFPLLMDALLTAQDIKYVDLQLKVFRWLGETYLKLGKPNAARDQFLNVLERAETRDINDLKVAVYIGLFKLQWFDLRLEITETLVQQALDTARLVEDRALQADLFNALAPIYARKTETEIALGYGQTAFAYWVSVNNYSGIGRTGYVLGGVYVYLNQLKGDRRFLRYAMTYLELAREALAHTDDVWQYPLLAYQQAVIYFQLGDYGSASSWYQQSLNEAESLNSPHYIVIAQHGFGLALSKLGQFSMARRYLRFALQYWEEVQNRYEQAAIYVGLADLELAAKDKKLARVYVDEGLAYVEDIQDANMQQFMRQQFQEVIDRGGL